MSYGRTTFSKFLIEEQHRSPQSEPALAAVLNELMTAIKIIAAAVSRGALTGALGDATTVNVQGETQKKLDLIANEVVLRSCEWDGHLLGMVSEELEAPHVVNTDALRVRTHGRYLLAFDPLDGSSNIDVNVSVGTIFSVLRAPDGIAQPSHADFLQPGTAQICAGYAIYGPAAMLVITLGSGVHGFTYDRDIGAFVLTHADMQVPAQTREFAINTSNERFWEPPVQRYVTECRQGRAGPRGEDFNMRWIASLVAEVHRILVRGGVFMYPRDTRDPAKPGRLRLLYEASPMAMLIEQAGGAASTGRQRLLDVAPTDLHQRVPVILGSRTEVERLERYHLEHDNGFDKPFESPLFSTRSLFRADAAG